MATVAVEMTGDEAKLWRAQQKVLAQQQKISNEYKKLAKEAKEAKQAAEAQAKAHEDAFGTRAVAALRSYAMGFGGISAAVGLVTAGLREMQQAAQEAAAAKRGAAGGLGMLAQMASTPAEFKAMAAQAKQLVKMGAAVDENEGARMVFDIHAAGAASEFDLLARAKAADFLEDPGTAAKAAQTIRVAMGEQETGSIGQILSKATAASKIAPGSLEQVTEAASRGGATAKAMGLTDEELLAATALASASSGSPEMGGTQVASLLRSLAQNKDYQGIGSLKEMVQKAQRENENFSEMTDLLGRAEAVNALNAIGSNMGQYDALLGDIDAANKTNIVEQRLGFAAGDASIGAAQLAKKSQGSELLSREGLGSMQNLADAAAAATQEGYRKKYGGFGAEALVAADKMSDAVVRLFAGPEHVLKERISGPNVIDPARLKELQAGYAAAKAQQQAAENLSKAAEALKAAAGGQPPSRAPAARAEANASPAIE